MENDIEKVKVACYDNPITMCREAHVNGKIKMAMTASMMLMISDSFVVPLELNHGPWNPGQIVGDPEAIDHNWGK